jgi:hypothetical protein
VVLGDPGYGKSWLVAQLTLRLLARFLGPAGASPSWPDAWEQALQGGRALLPVRLTCRELGERLAAGRSLPESVQEVVTGRLPVRHRDTLGVLLRECLEEERAVLCLLADGWDERNPLHEELLLEELGR